MTPTPNSSIPEISGFPDPSIPPEATTLPVSSSDAPRLSVRPLSNVLSDAPSAQFSSIPPAGDTRDSLTSLHSLVEPEELSVVFQPIVHMQTREIYAYEALVRCRLPELSPPPRLFERAIHHGCTGRLGRMIREIGIPLASGKPLFLNIHPRELSEGWLVRPDDPIYSHDHDVFLEVTESVPLTHFELCMSVLKEVSSRAGVHVVVDDLGAGYSNLLRIADLEPKVVKLDRILIARLDRSPRKCELVAAVVELCKRLGAEVVAEGVETLEEYQALCTTGAHYAQGYLFARPAFPAPAVTWPPEGV